MGIVEIILALALISIVAKAVGNRGGSELTEGASAPARELARMREALDDMSTRLQRLEEERDFYVDLLESPQRPRPLEAPKPRDETPEEG